MSDVFEVGQKVRHVLHEEAEVAYGPYESPYGGRRYVIRISDGTETACSPGQLTAIPTPPAFAVGDEVTLVTRRDGSRYTVEYGPFDDRDVYVVRAVEEPADQVDVRTFTASASIMRKVETPAAKFKVGDRVRMMYAEYADHTHGKLATVESVDDGWTPSTGEHHPYKVRVDGLLDVYWARDVEPATDEDTYEYNGVTYDLSAKYRDRDGDTWRFERQADGSVRGTYFTRSIDEYDDTLAEVVNGCGPLTRV